MENCINYILYMSTQVYYKFIKFIKKSNDDY